MDDSLRMGIGKSLSDLLANEKPLPLSFDLLNVLSQTPSRTVLCHHIVAVIIHDITIVKFEDVRVIQLTQVGDLSYYHVEVLNCIWIKFLNCYKIIMNRACLCHLSVSTLSQECFKFIFFSELSLGYSYELSS